MSDETLTADLFRPEDGEGVKALFTEIYGDRYPVPIVYDPDALRASAESGDSIPVVVRTSGGKVVGYSCLFRPAPNKAVYEKGNGAVSPELRNGGVMGLVFQYIKEMLPRMHDMDMFFGEAVCNHVYMQKAATDLLPLVETAVGVETMPADAYEKEQSAPGRVSVLYFFMTLTPRPHTVYVPPVYEGQLKFIYDGLDDRRTLTPSKEDPPEGTATRIETEEAAAAGFVRISVHEGGSDFKKAFASEEERIMATNPKVIQAALKLSCPWVGSLVKELKARGYFLGGVLPQWFGEDGLLMQKTPAPPDWQAIHLASDRAKKMLEFIREDR